MNNYNDLCAFFKNIVELHNIKVLEKSKMEFRGNNYFSFFEIRDTTEKKPTFNFSLLFIYIPFIIITIFQSTLFLIICLSTIPIYIMFLIIKLKSNIKKWEEVNDEYNSIVKNNKDKYEFLQNQIKKDIKLFDNYYPSTIILYNKIMSGERISKDDAIMFLINNKSKSSNSKMFLKCDYCDAFTIIADRNKNLKCCNCGSNLDLKKM